MNKKAVIQIYHILCFVLFYELFFYVFVVVKINIFFVIVNSSSILPELL